MAEGKILRQAVKSTLAMGAVGTLAGAGTALAQTAAPAAATSGQTQLSRITVTGSHIPRTSIANAQPVISINRQQIDATGLTTVGDLLQNLSSSGSSLNVQFNNGGNGMQLINLHDLGSQRVLVLVNGQRWVPTLFGAVDLTTIPLSVVDRIEVLLDGASAVYGSDAMAGVINIITKQNFDGAQANAYYGMYDGHGDGGGWDGKTQQYSFTVGTTGDRSSVLLSAGYYEQQAIWAGQRTISKEPYIGTGLTYGSPFTPGGNFWYFGPTGTSGPGCGGGSCFTVGPLTGPDANPQPYDPAVNNYNYAPANYLRTPSERWDIFSQGHYDLTDNVTFHFTTTYQRRNSVQALAPEVWFMGAYANGAQGANGLPLGVSGTNMYNPFGVDLVPAYSSTPNYQAWCSRFGTGGGGTCSAGADTLLLLGMQPTVAGNRIYSRNNATFYFNGGFNGSWEMFNNEWQWNTDYIFGQTLRTAITTGLANTARMQNALGPNSSCQSLPGCVPLDVFGGSGQINNDMLNYIQFTAHNVTQNVIRDYNANIAGSFWNDWYAGPWGAAVGYEYEAVDGFFSPDPLISEGNTVGNVVQPTSGRENTNAQYVELTIPFASNMPFAKELGLDLANRWSQFKWDGIGNIQQGTQIQTGPASGTAHSSTGRVTLKWRPINQLLIRAAWSQAFRTPSLSELFSGASDNYPNLNDPCATTGSLPPGCGGIQHTQPATQIHTTVGGYAGLQPEQSTSRSIGFVYSPEWAEGLDISADYFKVEILNTINRKGGQYYLDQCYIHQSADACSHIVTTPNGQVVTNVFDLIGNSGSSKVNGWDIDARYKLPTTPVGDFTVHLSMNFVKEDENCNSLGHCQNYAGSAMGGSFFGQPKHRYNAGLDWNYGPWAATWNVYLIGAMWENCGDSPLPVTGSVAGNWCSNPDKYVGGVQSGQNHLGTTVYHDVQASYTISSWNTTFTLGINNLFDKAPPISRTAFANSYLPVYYRTPGRFFYGRVEVHF